MSAASTIRPRVQVPSARVGPYDCVVALPDGTSLRVDLVGRWSSARLQGVFHRRTLDGGAVVYRGRDAPPVDVSDADALHDRIGLLAGDLRRRFARDEEALQISGGGSRGRLLERLALAEHWSRRGRSLERERYVAAYPEPVTILPPDRYLDVVVMPTLGCPNASCTFCAFYRDRRFRQRSDAEFAAHLDAVDALFGPASSLRTGVFLGAASALSVGQRRLVEVLAMCARRLGSRPRGIAGFWDPDHAPSRSPSEWVELAALGLTHVTVGLETGLGPLRAQVGKRGDLDAVAADLREVCESELCLGVVVLAGLGGSAAARQHREATVAFVGALPLRAHDIVYVSRLRGALDARVLEADARDLRHALEAVTPAQVTSYAVEDFRYYA